MMIRTACLGAFVFVACLPCARAQDISLHEVSASPGPQNPGVNYHFLPATLFSAEGSGIAVADVNGDSYLDMCMFAIEGHPNELYINNGNGTFTESAAAFGIDEPTKRRGNGLFLDYDNDGDLDLLTCGFPGDDGSVNLDLYSLFRNDGSRAGYHFTNVTAACGGFALAPTVETTIRGIPGGAAAGDYNQDGFVDAVVTYWYKNNPTLGYNRDQFRLWKNVANPNGDQGQPDYSSRLLQDATLEAGLDGAAVGQVWMPSFVDFNRDGYVDLHIDVEHDQDELRLNNGNGTFGPNIATTVGMNFNGWGPLPWGNEMGVALGDWDNDGDIDAYLTNASLINGPNKADAFYRNDTDLSIGGVGVKFQNIGAVAGVGTDSQLGTGWGAVFADLDNDGDKELVTARGLGITPYGNYLYRNLFPSLASDGKSVAMQDISSLVPEYSDAPGSYDNARSLVLFDFDNDGDLDAAYTRSPTVNSPVTGNNLTAFFVNDLANGNAWLELDLVEAGGSLNTTGARTWMRTGGVGGPVQMREVVAGSSYLSQEPSRLHFGLGSATSADWVAIRWVDGKQQVVLPGSGSLSGLLTVSRSAHDDTGDLDGDGDADPDDLALLQSGIASPATVDAQVPAWPWRKTGDLDGNGLLDSRDVTALTAKLTAPFTDVGHALAGTQGLPVLTGLGPLTSGSGISLTLSNAKASTNWWLIIGLGQINAPFKGGILVPAPTIVVGPLPTLAGSLPLTGAWPVGLPAGLPFAFQGWILDTAGPVGFAASNGLTVLTP